MHTRVTHTETTTILHTGELPLNMMQDESTDSTDGPREDTSLTKTFPMVTLAQW